MEKYLIDYYYYFLHERHYFECHEIMEEAWKEKASFSKSDIEVAFIMLATSQYHDRRHNKNGASRCLKKSLMLFKIHVNHLEKFGLQQSIISLLTTRLENIMKPYIPLQLPLTPHCYHELTACYPEFDSYRPADDSMINFHTERDRSDIIQLRERLMNDKYPVDNPPD